MRESLLEKRERLQKKRHILCSWEWFYSNNLGSLAISRYPKINRQIYDRELKENKIIIANPFINDEWSKHYGNSSEYSLRMKEDKRIVSVLIEQIRNNQLELSKTYKEE